MSELFLHIGAQKTGTTSIYSIWQQHKGINLANKKETKFFYEDQLYAKGKEFFLTEYFDRNHTGPKLDIDPDYIYFDFVPERIFESFGKDVKFIVTLRHPVERAFSHYIMEKYRNNESLSFENALAQEPKRSETREGEFFYAYIKKGLYSDQLENYLKFFPKENFSFYLFDQDFVQNKKKMMLDLCTFMGISWDESIGIDIKQNPKRDIKYEWFDRITRKNRYYNAIIHKLLPIEQSRYVRRTILNWNTKMADKQRLTEQLKDELTKQYFSEEIQKLEQLIDRDLSHWKV